MSRTINDALVRNLKLFNAKERDHLMRFAYLGENAAYSTDSRFLSKEFDALLREQMRLTSSAKCVFAGMDYHLDWIFAAIWLAKNSPAWTPHDELMVPMDTHEGVAGIDRMYTDFRPVSGSQEDIDLLVVYDDGEKLAVLFIEAKGSASFNKVQLARKVIRLDRILVDSGIASADRCSMSFRLFLAAPEKPSFDNCLAYSRSLPELDKFKVMRAALDVHSSGIGDCLHFLRLSGFPQHAYAVERIPDAGVFTHWTLRKRA
jgi:hypothetical protein